MNALDTINNATSGFDIFGAVAEPERLYKRLLRQVHPDMVDDTQKSAAEAAFMRLNTFWANFHAGVPVVTASAATRIRTKRHDYELGKQVGADEVFIAYQATYDADHAGAVLLVANAPEDEDLVTAYATTVKALAVEVPEAYRAFFPRLIEQFRHTQAGRTHPALALDIPGNLYSLKDIHAAYADGLAGRDMAWMWRRMLVAMGNTHDAGYVHGGTIADAWLIEPDQHGVVLVGWQYAVKQGEALAAIPQAYRDLYPAAVFDKLPATPALDIRLAAATMLGMLHHNAPDALRTHLRGCMLATVPPAAKLLAEFDELLTELYGKRTFHYFHMPPL